MAIFGKPPAKKVQLPKPTDRGVKRSAHVVSARELASQVANRKAEKPRGLEPLGETSLRGASIIDWSTAPKAIEVAQANPGLCAVLENAALLFANGQDVAARELLDQGVQTDADTKLSPLAWLALFDLMQRANDRTAFDRLSMQYVLQFERSAPSWEESDRPLAAKSQGGYVPITGRLTAASAAQIDGLRRAIARGATHARVDLAQVSGFDAEGARLLAEALADARKRACPLSLQRPEKLRLALAAATAQGVEAGEGAWLLALELLQWLQDRDAFENLAVDYAVAFEVSPPSWEPAPLPPAPPPEAGTAPPEAAPEAPREGEVLAWTGVMAGSALPHFSALVEYSQGRAQVPIDMSGVERVDFVCAGALLNAINRIEAQRKAVQIVGVSPIVRALLLLIGISPRHFLKKAQ